LRLYVNRVEEKHLAIVIVPANVEIGGASAFTNSPYAKSPSQRWSARAARRWINQPDPEYIGQRPLYLRINNR
jgi:hypothetical protein